VNDFLTKIKLDDSGGNEVLYVIAAEKIKRRPKYEWESIVAEEVIPGLMSSEAGSHQRINLSKTICTALEKRGVVKAMAGVEKGRLFVDYFVDNSRFETYINDLLGQRNIYRTTALNKGRKPVIVQDIFSTAGNGKDFYKIRKQYRTVTKNTLDINGIGRQKTLGENAHFKRTPDGKWKYLYTTQGSKLKERGEDYIATATGVKWSKVKYDTKHYISATALAVTKAVTTDKYLAEAAEEGIKANLFNVRTDEAASRYGTSRILNVHNAAHAMGGNFWGKAFMAADVALDFMKDYALLRSSFGLLGQGVKATSGVRKSTALGKFAGFMTPTFQPAFATAGSASTAGVLSKWLGLAKVKYANPAALTGALVTTTVNQSKKGDNLVYKEGEVSKRAGRGTREERLVQQARDIQNEFRESFNYRKEKARLAEKVQQLKLKKTPDKTIYNTIDKEKRRRLLMIEQQCQKDVFIQELKAARKAAKTPEEYLQMFEKIYRKIKRADNLRQIPGFLKAKQWLDKFKLSLSVPKVQRPPEVEQKILEIYNTYIRKFTRVYREIDGFCGVRITFLKTDELYRTAKTVKEFEVGAKNIMGSIGRIAVGN
jgi:hypothetical protein